MQHGAVTIARGDCWALALDVISYASESVAGEGLEALDAYSVSCDAQHKE